jgi:thiamine-phosphate pyrophosphorylase
MSLDLRLYLVSGEEIDGERAADVIAAAVAGGVTMVQLRAKEATTQARVEAARRLAPVLAPTDVPFLLNDDVEAARLAAVDGVHVGPDDVHPAEARSLLGPDALLGWSIHDLGQLADTEALAACDYLAASPVWATPTKTDITPPLGLEGVRVLRAAMPDHLPLVGIGGITAANAGEVIGAGAGGVAVVSAIWSASDPTNAARRLRAAVDAALDERGCAG